MKLLFDVAAEIEERLANVSTMCDLTEVLAFSRLDGKSSIVFVEKNLYVV